MEIASQAVGAAIPTPDQAAPGGGQGGAPKSAAGEDVARFEAALGGPVPPEASGPQGLGHAQQLDRPPEVSAAAAPDGTPGDAILRGLERMSERFNSTVERVNTAIEQVKPGQPISAADLLSLQFQLTSVTVQQDVASKVVGKATQNLDTFLKNQ